MRTAWQGRCDCLINESFVALRNGLICRMHWFIIFRVSPRHLVSGHPGYLLALFLSTEPLAGLLCTVLDALGKFCSAMLCGRQWVHYTPCFPHGGSNPAVLFVK